MRASLLPVVALTLASCAQAPPAPRTSTKAPGYEPLASFIGRWTLKGSEDSYLETCRWYEGEFHVICHTETKRTDGSVGKGMSVLGYLPHNDSYTYHGIGSKGRNETMSGAFRDGMFEFQSESTENGKKTRTRVRMGPFPGPEVPFVAETSINDAPWATDVALTYKRLE